MVAEDAEALELQRTLARAGLPCAHRVGILIVLAACARLQVLGVTPLSSFDQIKMAHKRKQKDAEVRGDLSALERVGKTVPERPS